MLVLTHHRFGDHELQKPQANHLRIAPRSNRFRPRVVVGGEMFARSYGSAAAHTATLEWDDAPGEQPTITHPKKPSSLVYDALFL
jgi:hypothetical protein